MTNVVGAWVIIPVPPVETVTVAVPAVMVFSDTLPPPTFAVIEPP